MRRQQRYKHRDRRTDASTVTAVVLNRENSQMLQYFVRAKHFITSFIILSGENVSSNDKLLSY